MMTPVCVISSSLLSWSRCAFTYTEHLAPSVNGYSQRAYLQSEDGGDQNKTFT